MHKQNDIEAERHQLSKDVRRELRLECALGADSELFHLRYGRNLSQEQLEQRKIIRSEVRSKWSFTADRLIGDTLPPLLQEFDDRVMSGELTTYEDGALEHRRPLRILDFDCECRPMAFYGGDWVTKEITAIAWKFLDQETTHHWLLTPSETHAGHVEKKLVGLHRFIRAYNKADIVTGHYIRGFDLPLVNAHCVDLGIHPLEPKMTHDTKGDLISMGGISKSQENLAAHFDAGKKESMNTRTWEVANTLVREGRRETKRRVVGDVVQHIQFRQALLDAHALMPPKVWTSGAKLEEYIG